MKKRYLDEANIYNVLLCIFVIFIHVSSEAVSRYDKDSLPYAVIFMLWKLVSFVVPGYFFLGGLRHFYSDKHFRYHLYLIDRLKRICMPYLLWVLIYYLYFIRRGYFGFDTAALFRYVFYGNLVAHFYFIVTILQFYLLMPVWHWMIRTIRLRYSLPAALLITIFCRVYLTGFLRTLFHNPEIDLIYNDRILTSYLLFWVLGCYAGAYYTQFVAWAEKYKKFIIGLFIAISSLHLTLSYLNTTGIFYYKHAELIHILFCLISTVFLYWACKRSAVSLVSHAYMKNILRTLNQVTFYVYLSHIYIINRTTVLLDSQGVVSITQRFFVRAACAYVLAFAGSLLYVHAKRLLKEKRHAYQNT